MPQGLCNTPATFQKAMNVILADLKLSTVLVYLDNINVFNRTFNEHLIHLEEEFKRLINANLKLKPRKYTFFKDKLEYLGYVINKMSYSLNFLKLEQLII